MVKGKTSSGFEFKVDENTLDDMRILDMVTGIANGDITQLSPLTTKILGSEQKEKLYAHIEEKYGRVSIQKVSDEMTEIFSGCKSKNSSPSSE